MKTALRHAAYISADGSYGSSQMWFPAGRSRTDDVLRADGCGAVAAADTLAYLKASGAVFDGARARGYETDRAAAMRRVAAAHDGFARVHRVWGALGTALARGLRREFRRCGAPFTARWYCPPDSAALLRAVREMLARDLPVVLSLSPRPYAFSPLWLYKDAPGKKAREFRGRFGHYVVVTALDEREDDAVLTISSWGERYEILWSEYARLRRTLFGKLTGGIVRVK